ncbi:MAG: hypothetical protein E4H01_12155 [Lysobacterales bacterium]|nr:MAG: hypothetical protein E4H01_12155 [Xanthomonadales bacterium]
MKFPYEPAHINHKAGGKITLITGIGHALDKPQDGRSRDYWYFRGNVNWRDGTKSVNTEIAPPAVCYSDAAGKPAVDLLMAALNDYLLANGEWCREGWYAARKVKRAA